MFNTMKTAAARMFINQYINGIGTVTELTIDKSNKSIVALVEMAGEPAPVRIEASGYILGADHIAISRFICDKPWMETALNRFLASVEFKLPPQAVGILKSLL
jgi:hypothetical protein